MNNRARSGTAAILGAIILFAMIFTAGAAYFTVVTQSQQNLNAHLLSRSFVESNRLQEQFSARAMVIQSTGNIGINITNTGSLPIKIVAIIITHASNVYLRDGQPGSQTNPNLPLFVNPSSSIGPIDTGIYPVSGQQYYIKIFSNRGKFAQASYPVIPDPIIAAVAQTTLNSAIGNLLIDYSSFQKCMPATQDCTPSSSEWTGVWELSPSTGTKYLFRVKIANFGPKALILDSHTGLFLLRAQDGGGGSVPRDLYIVSDPTVNDASNDGAGAYTDFSKILPNDGSYVTLYFGADSRGGSTLRTFSSNNDAGIHLATVVIFGYSDQDSNGTKNAGDTPYGQSIPFQGIVVA